MNKYIKLFLLLVTVIAICLILAACNNDNTEIPTLNLYGISFMDKSVTYDGNTHDITVAGNLQEGVSVKYSGNGQTNAGSYTVTASFYYGEHHYAENDMTATLTIKKATYDVSGVIFDDKTVTYNGKAHSLTVENLPKGLEVSYQNNGQTNAGIYTVTANISGDTANYFAPAPLTAKLIISKATYDMSQVVFKEKNVTYDGNIHSLEAINLPSGVSVSYENNGQINAGKYTVKAIFSGDNTNYSEIPSLEATLNISKAYYNTDSIVFQDKSVIYNGQPQSILATGLPEGVTATYSGNGQINAGTYTVTVSYKGDYDNFYEIDGATATLTIVATSVDGLDITFPDGTFTYDGTPKSIYLIGDIPSDISVSYIGNGKTDAGTYTVTAILESPNYDELPAITATLKINKATLDTSNIEFDDLITTYDGSEKNIFISGSLPEGVEVEYSGNGQINAGSYTVTAKFIYSTQNYNDINDKTATLIINRASFDSSTLTFLDKEVDFDGEAHSITLVGRVPDGIEYKITGGDRVGAGVYTLYVYFYVNEPYNFNSVETLSAKLTIKSPASTSSGILFGELDDGNYEVIGYNGNSAILSIPSSHNGKSVTSISSYAFRDNNIITYVYIPSTITNIGNGAFKNCTALANATICDGIKTIGSFAFDNTALSEITIPDSVTAIGFGAFRATVPESCTLPIIGGAALSSNSYLGYIFGASSYAATGIIPETLKFVTVSSACKDIPAYAFYGCSSIENLIIEKGVESIGICAFNGCISLKSIYLPSSVKAVYANAPATNSPFFGCSDDLLIVLEQAPTDKFCQFWSNTDESEKALTVYMKSYDDYMKNKESYRTANPADADLSAIIIGDKILEGFSPNTYDYQYDTDINAPLPEIIVAPASSSASITILRAEDNNSTTVITVTSANGESTKTYNVKFNTVGTFDTSSKVVLKDGKLGTVTYVIDDGLERTANNCYAYTAKYDNLVFSYALKVQDLATLITAYDTDTGKYYYVMEDGKYTYDVNSSKLSFWQDIIEGQNGLKSEITSHTFTHAYWGYHDDGGTFEYLNSSSSTSSYAEITLPIGSASKEIYASKQIIEELFGGTGGLTLINPGIASNREDKCGDNGVFYPTCLTIYKELYKQALENGDIITRRTTFSSKSDIERGVTYHYELADKENRSSIPSYMIYDDTSTNGSNYTYFDTEWKPYIDKAMENFGWAVFCIHNIANSYYAISDAEANKLFAYTDRDEVWVATYSEASLYYCEWSTANVSTSYANGELKVTLTDGEKDEIFNMPLTVEVKVPSDWGSAISGNNLYEVRSNGEYNYILIDIVPDSGTVTITRG